MKKRRKKFRIVRTESAERGQLAEERALGLIKSHLPRLEPHLYVSAKKTIKDIDSRGMDILVTVRNSSGQIQIPIEVKSCPEGVVRHRKKYPAYHRLHMLVLVVNDFVSDETILALVRANLIYHAERDTDFRNIIHPKNELREHLREKAQLNTDLAQMKALGLI